MPDKRESGLLLRRGGMRVELWLSGRAVWGSQRRVITGQGQGLTGTEERLWEEHAHRSGLTHM